MVIVDVATAIDVGETVLRALHALSRGYSFTDIRQSLLLASPRDVSWALENDATKLPLIKTVMAGADETGG